MFENHRKSLIQHCERSEVRLHFAEKCQKCVHGGEFLKTWSLRSNSVTKQVSFNRTTIGGKCQNSKIQMRHFGWYSNTVSPPLRHQKRFLVLVLKRGDVGKGWPSSRHVSSCSPTESQCAESPEYRILIERGWRWHWIGVQTGQPCPFVKLGKLQCRFLKEASTHFKAN